MPFADVLIILFYINITMFKIIFHSPKAQSRERLTFSNIGLFSSITRHLLQHIYDIFKHTIYL
jgi:hypothetical protein